MIEELSNELEALSLHYESRDREKISRQYYKAAQMVKFLDTIPADPSEITHVGDTIRNDIAEFRTSGEIERLEEMRDEKPHLEAFADLDHVGPRLADIMYNDLGVETIDEVRKLSIDELTEAGGIGIPTAEKIRSNFE